MDGGYICIIMKTKNIALIGAVIIPLLAGCASKPITLSPIGPNPVGIESMASGGELQVFSKMVGRSEGNNPAWYQHTDYYIYDLHGKLVKHIHNTVGHYAKAPCLVALPAGNYLVKAKAKNYFWVDVPVTIEDGKTTDIHLETTWKVPSDASTNDVVYLPDGYPVGWKSSKTK
jgi:hypothetical protein